MDVFKYFNQSLAADELNLVSLPLPNDPPFRLSSWVVPPTCKVMGEVTHCQGKCLWHKSSLEQRLAFDLSLGAEPERSQSPSWSRNKVVRVLKHILQDSPDCCQIVYWTESNETSDWVLISSGNPPGVEWWAVALLVSWMLLMAEGPLSALGWTVVEIMKGLMKRLINSTLACASLFQVCTWGHRQGTLS